MNNLMKWDPFAELSALQKQFFGDDWITPVRSVNIPTTDVYTNDGKELILEAHLPNFKEDDINVQVENGALVVSAEKHEKEEDKKKKYVIRESSSSFYRRIQLPDRADANDVKAHMEDGILKVTVPLKELPAPKSVSITSGKNK
jgi:HSP20 family protein